uniref:Lipoxygenase domain-containing protein n=1 Tax=Alexandrium catenella TaxID=2925 RepID=A0A7S1PYE6_ALECA
MCWVQPKECVWSWKFMFKTYSGCEPEGDGRRWCARYKYHIPGRYSHCYQVPCEPKKHEGESLEATERILLQAATECKMGGYSASSKANCICGYGNTPGVSSKTTVQRCSALTGVAQDIAHDGLNHFGCSIVKRGTAKQCRAYLPWYLIPSYHITQTWDSILKWGTENGQVRTDSCYASNSQVCSQDNYATKKAKCSDVDTSVLTADWTGMPANLQGVFWLKKQGDSSALVSFGRTRDGGGMSSGKITEDGKYWIRVGGDRSWSFAKASGGSFVSAGLADLVYEFHFNSATDPTFAQIIPQVRNALSAAVPPWLLSFDMSLSSNPNLQDSVVWQRTSSFVGQSLGGSAHYQITQVIDSEGNRLKAFDEWVAYCEDPDKTGNDSPGYIWLRSIDRPPFVTNSMEEELAKCPSLLGWALPSLVDKAYLLSKDFAGYKIRNLLTSAEYEEAVFDDFTTVAAMSIIGGALKKFGGRYETPAQRMCIPTETRPLAKFRTQENIAPSEEIDSSGHCGPGDAFEFPEGAVCAFLAQASIAVRDDMDSPAANTWALALAGKGDMTKEAYLMSFVEGQVNKDKDPIYPAQAIDYTKNFYRIGTGWEDALETHLTLDMLGTHLVTQVEGAAPSKGGETAALVVKLNYLSGLKLREGFAGWGGDMYFSAEGKPLMVELVAEDGTPKQVWADAPRDEWEYAKWVYRSTMMTSVTLIDHLWFSHLSVSNVLATATRERLQPSHPLRRLLSIATFRTIEVNSGAGHFLLHDNQLLQRASPFADWSAVHDAGEDHIHTYEEYFGAIMDKSKLGALPQRLQDAPFNQDAPELFEVISQFIEDFFGVYPGWCEATTDIIKDVEVQDFAGAMEDWLVHERASRAAKNIEFVKGGAQGAWTCAALKKLLKVQLFTVSGFHQHVGKVADLVRNPELVGSSWAPGEPYSRPRQAMQFFFVSGSTGFTGVKMNSDFEPLFDGVVESSQVKAVLKGFRSKLQSLMGVIDKRNEARDLAYTRMHPDYAEISLFQ